MRILVEEIAKALADLPEKVEVTQVDGQLSTVLELRVDPSDLGKMIGKQGRTARSIRAILNAVSSKGNRRYTLDIVETAATRPQSSGEQKTSAELEGEAAPVDASGVAGASGAEATE